MLKKLRQWVGIEQLEVTAVENDAGGVALAPFDGELPVVDEGCHRVAISLKMILVGTVRTVNCQSLVRFFLRLRFAACGSGQRTTALPPPWNKPAAEAFSDIASDSRSTSVRASSSSA